MTRQTIALVGANGMLAGAVRRLAPADCRIVPLDLPDFDLGDRQQVLAALTDIRPQTIINCAAYTDVDGCESNEETATRVNGLGPGYLAEAARKIDAVLVHVSTDYVFDGTKGTPYTEEDVPAPQSVYGRSKLLGEQTIRESGLERFFIVRTSWLYGPGGKNFVETIARLAQEREELRVVADQFGSPTLTDDLARAIFSLLEIAPKAASSAPFGLYHFSGEGECSWFDFAEEIVDRLRQAGAALTMRQLLPITTAEYPLPAKRPAYSVFSKEKYHRASGRIVPHWRESLETYFRLRGTETRLS